jgi:uncharacterized heparinase superfamily protein
MSVGRRLLGFALCFVVGTVLSFIAMAAYMVLALPHDLRADDAVIARGILAGGFAFAIACDVVRAYFARSSRIPRATLTR